MAFPPFKGQRPGCVLVRSSSIACRIFLTLFLVSVNVVKHDLSCLMYYKKHKISGSEDETAVLITYPGYDRLAPFSLCFQRRPFIR